MFKARIGVLVYSKQRLEHGSFCLVHQSYRMDTHEMTANVTFYHIIINESKTKRTSTHHWYVVIVYFQDTYINIVRKYKILQFLQNKRLLITVNN